LHERKFVHGQLKPSNVLAVEDQLKLASDTVRAVGESADGMNTGSVYDAPEARDGMCSAAGDIWALGVTICEALTRRRPSGLREGESEVELPSDLPPPFREIVARCLNRNPRDRPEVAELQAWLRGEYTMGAAASLQPAAIQLQPSVMPEDSADQPASAEPLAQAAVVETQESPPSSDAAAKSQSDTTSKIRLVIRAEIIPKEDPQTTAPQHLNRGPLALVLGAVVGLILVWVGFSVFRTDTTPAPTAGEEVRNIESQSPAPAPSPSEAAAAVNNEPRPKPAASIIETRSAGSTSVGARSTEAKSVTSEVREKPDASPSPVKEVIPAVPRSALDTIRGTIRVSIRVIVDKDGTVLEATSQEPGPSRYFERLSIEAAKKWTFSPADTQEQRIILVRFNLTRAGVTARANPVQ
jgi:TonB family protein